MSKKRIDQIIAAAFDEGQVETATLSGAERAELERARAIRDGLRSLAEVPECQLSEERLRNAILSSAVRPSRMNAWSLATAALACVAIAAVVFVRPQPSQREGRVALQDSPKQGDIAASIGLPDASTGAASGQPVQTGRTEPSPVVAVKEPAPAPVDPAIEAYQPAYRRVTTGTIDPYLMNVSLGSGSDVAVGPANSTEPGREDRGPLVVVDAESVTRNGAAKATEVAAYGEVVFGG